MDYLSCLLLFYSIFDLFCSILSLYFSINVLFRKNLLKKSVNISFTMTFNFIFVFIFSILSLIYNFYLIIFWRPNISDSIYDGRILYLTGILPWILINLNSIMEFFLCFDRCLALCFPFNYNFKTKAISVGVAGIGLVICLIISVWINNVIFGYPAVAETACRHIGCLFQSSLLLKIIFLLVNIFGVVILGILIKFILNNNSEATKRMNKTVLIMVFCTTFIELVPFIGASAFSMFTGLQLQKYIGPYGFSASTFNITFSAGIYYKAFKKNIASPVPTKITAFTSTYVTSNR